MGLLRFLLAVTVVMAHSGPILGTRFVSGQIAVEAFFIISGFYMALILNEKYIGVNNSYKLFITNRLLRLYPVYWTILLCTGLFSIAVYIYNHGHKAGFLQPYVDNFSWMSFNSIAYLIFTNLFLFFQDAVWFLGLDKSTGNLYFTSKYYESAPPVYTFLLMMQAWTIGLELIFYLIVPFLARNKLIIIFLLIVLSILLRIVLFHYGLQGDPWVYRFFPTELVFFLLGIISYKIYAKIKKVEINKFYLKPIWGMIVVFTILYDFIPLPGKIYIYFLTFFLCIPFVFLLTSKWKPDQYLGDLSYPIYLSHILVFAVMHGLKVPMIGGAGLSLTLCTIVFSVFLNELVAKRIERIRQNRIKPVHESP